MTKREDGLWQQTITIEERGRKKKKYFYGRTKREVLEKIRNYKEAEESGPLFEEVADDWWEEHQKTIAPTTVRQYIPPLNRALERFSGERIRNIKTVDVNNFMRNYIQENHPAQKTAAAQLTVLNMIFRRGTQFGYIDANPCWDIRIPRGLPHNKRDAAGDEDIERIKNSRSCTFGDFAFWALYTGLRRGELLALTWDDVDLEERTITVKRSMYRVGNGARLKEPKTKAGIRKVPILDALYAAIDGKKGEGYIFPGNEGTLMTENKFGWLWELYVRESGVTCTPHQLRHAFATMLFEAQVDPKDAQTLLGHAREYTTREIYTHIRESHAKAVRDSLLSMDYKK